MSCCRNVNMIMGVLTGNMSFLGLGVRVIQGLLMMCCSGFSDQEWSQLLGSWDLRQVPSHSALLCMYFQHCLHLTELPARHSVISTLTYSIQIHLVKTILLTNIHLAHLENEEGGKRQGCQSATEERE